MNTKIAYIALAVAAGSLVISATAAVVSLASSGAQVSELIDKVEILQRQIDESKDRVSSNRQRIDELDYGLTAIAQVGGMDIYELSRATQQARKDASSGSSQDEAQPDDAIDFEMFLDELRENDASQATDTAAAEPAKATQLEAPPLAVEVKAETPARVDGILAQRLSNSWKKPEGDLQGLKAVIQMKLKRNGELDSVSLVESSGSEKFDLSAKEAISTMGQIAEVANLSDSDYKLFYEDRTLVFAPN